MANQKLEPALLAKMAAKIDKQPQYVREQISRRAGRNLISSPAAQLLWAKELGIGIAVSLRHAEPSVREEVRAASNAVRASPANGKRAQTQVPHNGKQAKPNLGMTIDFVLEDVDLRGRCKDLLLARKHYDRVVREATTVLDDRLKTLAGISHMNPAALVGKALNPDPNKAVIVVSQDKDEQQGFHAMCNGVMLAFRNKAHHSLSNAFTQADALKFCGFIDTILGVLKNSTVHPERV